MRDTGPAQLPDAELNAIAHALAHQSVPTGPPAVGIGPAVAETNANIDAGALLEKARAELAADQATRKVAGLAGEVKEAPAAAFVPTIDLAKESPTMLSAPPMVVGAEILMSPTECALMDDFEARIANLAKAVGDETLAWLRLEAEHKLAREKHDAHVEKLAKAIETVQDDQHQISAHIGFKYGIYPGANNAQYSVSKGPWKIERVK